MLADYDFNAVDNPSVSSPSIQWAAVLTNVNYKPFLSQRFPDATAYYLSRESPPSNGGWMLFVIPVTERLRPGFLQWNHASRSQREFTEAYISYVHGKPFGPVIEKLFKTYPAFRGDPFLESVYWEKVADCELKMGLPDHQAAIGALTEGLKNGYPASHLYYDLGAFYSMDHQPNQARRAFQRARQAPLDFTGSEQMLKALK